ncbi:MAG: GMC family oxidoreductase N-terminal domain-containing protein [Methylobacteriaceae bacterium]|nr:GMC family oxidoreductase N-terminal domain-containing protein [Methylobacteriaceae bacterium]
MTASLPHPSAWPDSAEAFDYVVVGGGTAGCALAARLSEDGRRSVILLEAGGDRHSLAVSVPAAFGRTWHDRRFNWAFRTEPEETTGNRAIAVPRGRSLGGSTLINGMIWVRGQPQDFDGWAQAGARGWSFADVLPYFRRIEAYSGGETELRGRDGPVTVVDVPLRHEIPDAFLRAAEQAGYPRNPDYNGREQEGFSYYQANQRRGRRWSAFHAYLKPALGRSNLCVRTDAQAVGIEIRDGRAAAVRYLAGGVENRVAARAEIVLAAGAIQTPHLLELSGIGRPEVLQAAGIQPVLAAPGVGRNYQDHFATRMNWRVTRPITLNEMTRGRHLLRALAQYALSGSGVLAYGTGIAGGFVRTRPGLETPDIQYFFVHASYANAADRVLDRAPGMTIGVTQLRPGSRGTIHVASPDPLVPPAIRPNFLSDPADGECLAEGMRIARRIMAQPAMDPYRAHEMNPGEGVQSDAEWLDYSRRTGQTIYHPVGTCRMGEDPEAVVDSALRLRELRGLRIADASVMPRIVSANTQAAVFMIAEKAADLIRRDHA